MKIENYFMDAFERGIDRTNRPPGDCNLYANAPLKKRIPLWWLEDYLVSEITKEEMSQLSNWIEGIQSGTISLEENPEITYLESVIEQLKRKVRGNGND